MSIFSNDYNKKLSKHSVKLINFINDCFYFKRKVLRKVFIKFFILIEIINYFYLIN